MPQAPARSACREAGGSGLLARRTVHVHPTLRCNLACGHCYSSSGPGIRGGLTAAAILEALAILKGEGYEIASLSGGEPFLFEELDALTEGVRRLGMGLTAISNGSALRACPFLDRFKGVAISLDGLETTHNRLRRNPRAFTWAMQGLGALHRAGVPAAAAVCVTRASLPELPAIAALAQQSGLSALQLRPLVMTGRATAGSHELALSEDDLNTLVVLATALGIEYEGSLPIHLDVAGSRALLANRNRFAALLHPSRVDPTLSDLVNPLVITDQGLLLPFTYDFPREFRIGALEAGLRADIDEFKTRSRSRLAGVVDEAFSRLDEPDRFVDWYAHATAVAVGMSQRPHGTRNEAEPLTTLYM